MRTWSAVVIVGLVACQHGTEAAPTKPPKPASTTVAAPRIEVERAGAIAKAEPAPMLVVMRDELARAGFVGRVEPRTLRDIVAFGKAGVATHHLLVGGNPMGWGMPPEYAPFVSTATIVAPSVLVGELELHRDKGGNPKPPSYPKPKLTAAP